MPPATTTRHVPTAWAVGLVGVATGLSVAWAHWLDSNLFVGMVPIGGITLGALLLMAPRRWPSLLLAMVGAVTAVGLALGSGAADAVAPAVAAGVSALLAAVLVRAWTYGQFALRRAVDLGALVVFAAVGAAAGAVAAVAIAGTGSVSASTGVAIACAGAANALGAVVVTTAMLAWTPPTVDEHQGSTREAVLLGAAVVGGAVALGAWSDPLGYVVALPVLLWAAYAFRLRGAATAGFAMLVVGSWAIARDTGPLADAAGSTAEVLLTFQAFAAVAVLSALLLAAALNERDDEHARRMVITDRFRRTFDAAPIGIALVTLDGVIVDANSALCTTLGYSRPDLVGTAIEALRSPDDPSGELRWDAIATTADAIGSTERRYVSGHGERVWAEVVETQVRGADGAPESLVVMLADVTRRKELEEQVLHSQKMDAVGRLAGGIAHDFNNLLSVMRGHAELLDDELAVVDQARHRLLSMRRATDRAAALTNDLLSFSRRTTDEPETIDVHDVIGSSHDMLTQLASASVTIDLRLDATASRIHADPRRIEQVLVNLVVNAADAMPYGGRVTVATADVVPPGADGPRALVVAVTDTGGGITPQVQRRIFEPFFTTKPPGSGTGLGLSTAAEVVRRYGGTITVDSRLHEGTTFVITLPLAVTESVPAQWTPDVPRVPGPPDADARRATILVVDDEADVRTNVADVLRGCGYRVLEAGDADAALDLAIRGPETIDLVVSDVVMPGVGGPELADLIHVERPDTEVLFVSGHPDFSPTAPCLRGAPLLRKPLVRAALVAEVETALARHAGRVRARSGTPHPGP